MGHPTCEEVFRQYLEMMEDVERTLSTLPQA